MIDSKNIVKILSKHNFEEMWQLCYTMLSLDLGVTHPYSKTKQRFCSFIDKNWFFICEKNKISMYYSKEEMKFAGYWGKRDFLNDKWFKNHIKESKRLYKSASNIFHKYNKPERLKNLSKNNLYLLVKDVGIILCDNYIHGNISQPQCVVELENDLRKDLKKYVPTEKIRDVMLDLTQSEKITMLEQESIDWLILCSEKLTGYNFKNKLKKHSRAYGVLGTSDRGSYYDVDYYKKLYKKQDKDLAKQELIKKKNEKKEIAKRKKDLIKKYNISSYTQKLSSLLAEISHNRFELRLRGWMVLNYWFIGVLLPYIKQQTDVKVELLRQMSFQELLQFLLTGWINKGELKKREEFFVVGMADGHIFYSSNPKIKKEFNSLIPFISKDVKEIIGQIAKAGLVRGRVCVLKWDSSSIVKKMKGMKKGSILVVGQTRPHLMPAIRKSSAIITDEGGITSHAAVIGRELGIPFIMGTKIATKVLKDGDEVEVDANKGIVKILKRK